MEGGRVGGGDAPQHISHTKLLVKAHAVAAIVRKQNCEVFLRRKLSRLRYKQTQIHKRQQQHEKRTVREGTKGS